MYELFGNITGVLDSKFTIISVIGSHPESPSGLSQIHMNFKPVVLSSTKAPATPVIAITKNEANKIRITMIFTLMPKTL